MMESKRYMLHTLLVLADFASIAFTIEKDVCSLPPDNGVCTRLFIAWYYNSTEEQCREFIYGGCGGNGNRFTSEVECYKNCRERLIELHPPESVRVAFTLFDRIFLIWYQPKNYKLHKEADYESEYLIAGTTQKTLTAKGSGVTHIESKILPVTTPKAGDTTKPPQNSTETVISNSSNSDIDKVDKNNTLINADKNSTLSTNTNMTSDLDSHTNVTESGINNKTDSVSNNQTETSPNNTKEQITTVKSDIADTTQVMPVTKVATDSATDDKEVVVYQLKDFIGKKKVPFHFGVLKGYIVSYRTDENAEWTTESVPPNRTEYWIRDLTPSTLYAIRVGAVYKTNTTVFAEVKAKTQPDPTTKGNCRCNEIGAVGGGKRCNYSLTLHPWCKCKPGYSGLFCELCHTGYYRISHTLPCHRCPCSHAASSQACHFVEGYLHCLSCKLGYMGRLCQHCDNGYFRDHRHTGSVCVKCRGCHDVGQGLICDPFTGRCTTCQYNTTGKKCDKCLPGFEGDPLKGIQCTWIEPEKPKIQMLSSGVIAVICVVTILVISGVVGFIIYRRMRNYPSHRPFWTIELKESHEGVNFSSVPDDDMDRYNDDVRFIEKESKGKSQPYSRLREDM